MEPKDLGAIRNITVSGRIGSGATTLATHLANTLSWNFMDGGKIFRALTQDHGFAKDRDDNFDIEYEEKIKKIQLQRKGSFL